MMTPTCSNTCSLGDFLASLNHPLTPCTGPAKPPQAPVFVPQTRYRTQAGALLRKNAVYQLRNRKTNCCIVFTPVLFILLLFGIQQAVNFAFGGRDYEVNRAPWRIPPQSLPSTA